MSRWEHAPEIAALAAELGIGRGAPVQGILDYCRSRIDDWVSEAGGVTNIDALEAIVTEQLQLTFEEIKTDDDWDRLTDFYARGKKEFVFAGIRTRFDDDEHPTYGALVERRNAGADDPDRYVAVIDCRGSKNARRFFTRWHEIAHRLTTHADMLEPVYRSEHDPIERLMDEIAGHVGFYEPIFSPAYRQVSQGKRHLSLGMVEAIISEAFPTASFQATLFACTRRLKTPVVYLEATLAHKKEVKRRLATRGLFDDDPPPGELRATKVIPNAAAQDEGFIIPTNMRVPSGSVIESLFGADLLTENDAQECLSQWESQGKSLDQRQVVVEGRNVGDKVIAIVQPVAGKSPSIHRESRRLFSTRHSE
jgi:hypothetical protein